MQKKLIALAIAGLSSTAFAQSNVTISGQLKGGFQQYKITNGGAALDGKQNLVTDETSSFVLKGTESLGNGLSAIFQIDNRFTIDGHAGNGTIGGGNTHVGLKTGFGEFKIGNQDLHYNEIERIENGAKSLSQQAVVGRGILNKIGGQNIGAGQTRSNNVIFWDSPNWSGFNARLAYSTAPIGGEGPTGAAGVSNPDKGNAWNAVLRYENGPVKVGGSYYRQSSESSTVAAIPAGALVAGAATQANTDQTSGRFWGAYNFAGFSVGLAYDRSKIEFAGTELRRNGWAIPVSYNVGNHGIYVTYAKVGDVKGAAVTDSTGAKQWTLGYDYNLSKRTSVGANYTKLTNESNAGYNFGNLTGTSGKGTLITAAGADAAQIYVGVRHAY